MKLTVAVIGSGKSAAENHIPAYLRMPEAQVVAMADADLERARSVAAEFGIKGAYDDYVVMMRRRRPNVVSVCTAPSEHKEAVVYALSHGAHVLCDMPMATNAEEGEVMLETAREAEKVLVFAAPRRYEAQAITVKQAIVNGDLGAICFCRAWSRRETIAADDLWQIKTREGGGALSVSGQEMFDLAFWLTGDEPVSVSGRLFYRFPNNADIPKTWFGSRRELDAEDLAIALVRCQKSVVALEVDWLSSGADAGVFVAGTKGRAGTSPFRMEVASKGQFVDTTPTFFPETGAWDEVVRSFVDAASGQQNPFPDGKETLLVQRVCDAVRQSSTSEKEIFVSGARRSQGRDR